MNRNRPIKITQLVGDYGHLYWTYGRYEPNQNDRDTRVDIEPVSTFGHERDVASTPRSRTVDPLT